MKTLQQELPKRFIDATIKLYRAFHENRLNAMDCNACAVGNMCDGDNNWNGYRHSDYSDINVPLKYQEITGYSAFELRTVEKIFMHGSKMITLTSPGKVIWAATNQSKEQQFKGLCAVIEYLCELDNIPNIMDFTSLFETENDVPKRELCEVFN